MCIRDRNNRIINITGKKAGVTTINVGADDATRKPIKVTVLQPGNDLAFSPNAYEMIAGETYTPNLVKTPDDSTDAITWVSYNPDIADVDEKGVITAKKTGVTFIQATSASGRVAVIQITVKETLTAVTLKPEKATIEVGESMTCLLYTSWNLRKLRFESEYESTSGREDAGICQKTF